MTKLLILMLSWQKSLKEGLNGRGKEGGSRREELGKEKWKERKKGEKE